MIEFEATNALGSGIAHETPESQTEAEPKIECDNEYYFQEDPMAVFLVENNLFKIHRHFLLEGSEVFRDMFASPAEGTGPEGTSNKQPISLPEVTKGEFKALLDYFYLPPHRHWHPPGDAGKNLQIYTDLLSIAHRFLFDEIFQYVVGKLEPMMTSISAVQRFALGQKYGFKEWMFSAYESWLDSETTPTVREFEILGFDKAVRLMQARDAMHHRHLQEIIARCRCTLEVDAAPTERGTMSPMRSIGHRRPLASPTVLMTTQIVRPSAKAFVRRFFES